MNIEAARKSADHPRLPEGASLAKDTTDMTGTQLSSRANRQSARISELDALRGLAAFGVMAFHYTSQYQVTVGHLDKPGFLFPAGNYGVQLFFLISGFVIFMTLDRTQRPIDFVVSRFSRLFPAYWTAILISAAFIYTIGLPEQRLPPTELAANFTMIQQFLHARHLDGAYWTLQIELFFYVQMLFWFVAGALRNHTRWIIVGWLVLCLVYKEAEILRAHLSWTFGELMILQQIPFFALGILFYQLYTRAPDQAWVHALIVACNVVIGLTREPVFLAASVVCTLVFHAFVKGWLTWLASRPFALLGAISYSLYLLHQAIGFDVIWHLEKDAHASPELAILGAMTTSILLAIALTYLVELPAMRWIRTAWKNRTQRKANAVTS